VVRRFGAENVDHIAMGASSPGARLSASGALLVATESVVLSWIER
jgi:hypothetical protein